MFNNGDDERTKISGTRNRRFPGETWKRGVCRESSCGQLAALGHLCRRHARALGLELRPSRFGGLGLFAAMPRGAEFESGDGVVFFAGEPIAEYGGRLTISDHGDAGIYGMAFGEDYVIDGQDSNSSLARFANDGTFENCNNAEFSHYLKVPSTLIRSEDGERRASTPDSVWLEAIRDIHDGEEILASYGAEYWKDAPQV